MKKGTWFQVPFFVATNLPLMHVMAHYGYQKTETVRT